MNLTYRPKNIRESINYEIDSSENMLAKRLTTSEEVHKAEVLSKAVAICTVPNVEESVSGKVPIATSSSKEQND